TPSPFSTTKKIDRGPKAPKPRTEPEAFRFTPHSILNKARPRALGRSAGSFPVVLFPPRERHTEEVCPARGGSVESLSRKRSGANFSYLLSVPPFGECPARFTGLLAYQALARCSCRPPSGRSARYPDFSLNSITSHCSSHKLWQLQLATTGARARVGSAASLHSNYVGGSFAFARSREILQVLRPRLNRRRHLVHRYYQKVSCWSYSY
ncbi:hypothetical protein RJ640_029015, partial [Escallonia rubra]